LLKSKLAAEQRGDERHDHVPDHRLDDLAEGRADDHADREVDGVALDREFPEFLSRLIPVHSLWCGVARRIAQARRP
jgi:hypothetical protein